MAISEVNLVISDVGLDNLFWKSAKSPLQIFRKWVRLVSSIEQIVEEISLDLEKCQDLYRFGKASKV